MQRLRNFLKGEPLFAALLLALPLLAVASPLRLVEVPMLVDWKTIFALLGLIILSRGLEESGGLARLAAGPLKKLRSPRSVALAVVLFSALSSAVITNDVALFIVVPLIIALGRVLALPVGRLVIFSALAVNAGSAVSPVGNPQNLFLWQTSDVTAWEFVLAMAPLSGFLMALLLGLTFFSFSSEPLPASASPADPGPARPGVERPLLFVSLILYLPFLVLTDLGLGIPATLGIALLYLAFFRGIVWRVDWLLLLVFVLMFLDMGLLASLPPVQALAAGVDDLPGGVLLAGALLSQGISNVPATLLLEPFTEDWRALAWGVSVGGFGLAIGSLANLIALRLAREEGLMSAFHRFAIPLFLVALPLTILLFSLLYGP